MAQDTAQKRSTSTSAYVVSGVIGGLAGGVLFGLMMQFWGMLPMIAMLVGSEAVAVGWVVHLVISALFGAVFGVIVGMRPVGRGVLLGAGAAYGVVLWVVGALVAMPVRLGMDVFMINGLSLRSLLGHLVFGVVLAAVVALLARRRAH